MGLLRSERGPSFEWAWLGLGEVELHPGDRQLPR